MSYSLRVSAQLARVRSLRPRWAAQDWFTGGIALPQDHYTFDFAVWLHVVPLGRR